MVSIYTAQTVECISSSFIPLTMSKIAARKKRSNLFQKLLELNRGKIRIRIFNDLLHTWVNLLNMNKVLLIRIIYSENC